MSLVFSTLFIFIFEWALCLSLNSFAKLFFLFMLNFRFVYETLFSLSFEYYICLWNTVFFSPSTCFKDVNHKFLSSNFEHYVFETVLFFPSFRCFCLWSISRMSVLTFIRLFLSSSKYRDSFLFSEDEDAGHEILEILSRKVLWIFIFLQILHCNAADTRKQRLNNHTALTRI